LGAQSLASFACAEPLFPWNKILFACVNFLFACAERLFHYSIFATNDGEMRE
jgi:hypothetical protein